MFPSFTTSVFLLASITFHVLSIYLQSVPHDFSLLPQLLVLIVVRVVLVKLLPHFVQNVLLIHVNVGSEDIVAVLSCRDQH